MTISEAAIALCSGPHDQYLMTVKITQAIRCKAGILGLPQIMQNHCKSLPLDMAACDTELASRGNGDSRSPGLRQTI